MTTATTSNTHTYWMSEEGLTLLTAWARDGANDSEIAARCGIKPETLKGWKRKYPAIGAAVSVGREAADAAVEAALHRLAVGYESREERIKDGKGGPETTVIVKEVPPSVNAISLWLRSRKPEVWGDRAASGEAEALEKLDEILEELQV